VKFWVVQRDFTRGAQVATSAPTFGVGPFASWRRGADFPRNLGSSDPPTAALLSLCEFFFPFLLLPPPCTCPVLSLPLLPLFPPPLPSSFSPPPTLLSFLHSPSYFSALSLPTPLPAWTDAGFGHPSFFTSKGDSPFHLYFTTESTASVCIFFLDVGWPSCSSSAFAGEDTYFFCCAPAVRDLI